MPSRAPARLAIAFAVLASALALASIALPGAAAEGAGPQAASPFLDLRRQRPVTGDAAAGAQVAVVCSACHGARGIGISPTFPNLAGQSATYLYVQLRSFKAGARSDPVMAPMAAPLGDADMRNVAAHFASLPPRDHAGATTSRGATLYRDGDPGRGIPPCQGCHGVSGEGPPTAAGTDASTPGVPWATIPRLQGQSPVYLSKALNDFRSGARRGTSNAAIMHGVARRLDDADIQALSAYLGGP